MPPLPPAEILEKLTVAIAEAKTTIRELHEARSLALDVSKKDRERTTALIIEEVTKQVGNLTDEVRDQMHGAVSKIMARFETDWREKLGL